MCVWGGGAHHQPKSQQRHEPPRVPAGHQAGVRERRRCPAVRVALLRLLLLPRPQAALQVVERGPLLPHATYTHAHTHTHTHSESGEEQRMSYFNGGPQTAAPAPSPIPARVPSRPCYHHTARTSTHRDDGTHARARIAMHKGNIDEREA